MKVIYFHINPITLDIFYVGLGSKHRPYSTHRSIAWKNIVNKYGEPIIEIVETDLTLEEAIASEIKWIKIIGRRDLKEGTLINHTDGGEGTHGHKQSSETIAKRVAKNLGQKRTDIQKAKIRQGNLGVKRSEETKLKCSNSAKGKIVSEETKFKMSISQKAARLRNKYKTQ